MQLPKSSVLSCVSSEVFPYDHPDCITRPYFDIIWAVETIQMITWKEGFRNTVGSLAVTLQNPVYPWHIMLCEKKTKISQSSTGN